MVAVNHPPFLATWQRITQVATGLFSVDSNRPALQRMCVCVCACVLVCMRVRVVQNEVIRKFLNSEFA